MGDAMDVPQPIADLAPVGGLIELAQGEAHVGAAPARQPVLAQQSPRIDQRLPGRQLGIEQIDVCRARGPAAGRRTAADRPECLATSSCRLIDAQAACATSSGGWASTSVRHFLDLLALLFLGGDVVLQRHRSQGDRQTRLVGPGLDRLVRRIAHRIVHADGAGKGAARDAATGRKRLAASICSRITCR